MILWWFCDAAKKNSKAIKEVTKIRIEVNNKVKKLVKKQADVSKELKKTQKAQDKKYMKW